MVMLIRPTQTKDVPTIADIYGYHVLHGTGTFETEAPTADEIDKRHQAVLGSGGPHLVLCDDTQVLGFAYAQQFRPRQGFRFTLEDSIYLAPAVVGRGLGRWLLTELIGQAERLGARQMVAVIGDSNNKGSIALHTALGFVVTGRLDHAGWKHGRWLDVVLMQRTLGMGANSPPPTIA